MATSGRRTTRPLPKRRSRVAVKSRSKIITTVMTPKQRHAAGYRNECDICQAKIGAKLPGNKKVEIWSFTVKNAGGTIFNRCRKHLKAKVRV